MAQQNINIGSSANKGDGDPIRTAFSKAENNFTDLYTRIITVEAQSGVTNPGGSTIQQSIIGDVIGNDSTIIVNHATSTITANSITGDLKGSVVADDSTVLIDGQAGTISAGALTGTLPAIDGSSLTNLTIPAQTFASLTGKPTTVAGYGITDAQALLVSATNIKTINGATVLGSGDLTVTGTSDDTLQDYKANVNFTLTDANNTGGAHTNLPMSSDTSHERFTIDGATGTAVDLPNLTDTEFGKEIHIKTPGTGSSRSLTVYWTQVNGTYSSLGLNGSGATAYKFTWYGSYWKETQTG